MPTDTAQPDEHRDPLDGTAAVQAVTEEMMDRAAHAAAALADGVARHEVQPDRAAAEAFDTARTVADDAAGAARSALDAAGAAAGDLSEAAVGSAERALDDAGRTAEAERAGLSGSADALARYNAKLFEVMRANMASTTALFAALVQARSVPEALSINADHLRRQMDALTSQGRELAVLAQTIALDALQPPKGRDEG